MPWARRRRDGSWELYSGVGSLTLFLAAQRPGGPVGGGVGSGDGGAAVEPAGTGMGRGGFAASPDPPRRSLKVWGISGSTGRCWTPPRTGCHPPGVGTAAGASPAQTGVRLLQPRHPCPGSAGPVRRRLSGFLGASLRPVPSDVPRGDPGPSGGVSDSPFPPCERKGAGL